MNDTSNKLQSWLLGLVPASLLCFALCAAPALAADITKPKTDCSFVNAVKGQTESLLAKVYTFALWAIAFLAIVSFIVWAVTAISDIGRRAGHYFGILCAASIGLGAVFGIVGALFSPPC
jgi:hypothetical protein